MLPNYTGGHAAYQEFVVSQLRKYYPDPYSISRADWEIVERFWLLDLSATDTLMKDRYSVYGPKPRQPSCMLRSYLLSIQFKIFSLTDWAARLKISPLFAIVSGFEYHDTPGVGTFYDFLDRLWLSDEDNFSPHLRMPKPKVKKPSKKGTKAASVEKVTVEELLSQFAEKPVSPDQPYSLLLQLYKQQFLDVSIQKGLLNPESLALAGDGTPVNTSARVRRRRLCNCLEKGIRDCSCQRYYSQPDCDIGWDSSRYCFYHGYDLYLFTASDSESNLPVFPLLGPASRHDSLGFLHAFFSMKTFLPQIRISKLLLDSAHDAMPIYEYCRNHSITPFIDLNEKRGIKLKYKADFTIGDDGIPICPAGRKMNHDGVERKKHRIKFRCPLASRKYGCSCTTPCSD